MKNSQQFWLDLIRAFENSNMGQKEFAALHGVNLSTFRRNLYSVRRGNAVDNKLPGSLDEIGFMGSRVAALEAEKEKLASELDILRRALDSFVGDFKNSYEEFASRIRGEYFEMATARALGRSEAEILEYLAAAVGNRLEETFLRQLDGSNNLISIVDRRLDIVVPSRLAEHVDKLKMAMLSSFRRKLPGLVFQILQEQPEILGDLAESALEVAYENLSENVIELAAEHARTLAEEDDEYRSRELLDRVIGLDERISGVENAVRRIRHKLPRWILQNLQDNRDVLGELAEAELRDAFGNMRDSVIDLAHELIIAQQDDSGWEISSKVTFLQERMDGLEQAIERVGAPPEIVASTDKRIRRAQRKGDSLRMDAFVSPLTGPELVVALRARGFYLAENIARTIIDHLERRRVLVLEGVPGTGKSRLAHHLAELLIPDGYGSKFTHVNVHAEATTWHSIGGLRMVDRHFIPHFGWLTEAAIECIEKDGNHWLILDEINRGDISALLAPALDALEPNGPSLIDHPNLFPSASSQAGKIPLPGKFRIVGTLNPFDRDVVFEFTNALGRRIGSVEIPPLVGDEESSLVDRVVVRKRMREMGVAGNDLASFKSSYGLDIILSHLYQVVGGIRSLVEREPLHVFQYCEIGTALVIEMAERVCRKMTDKDVVRESSLVILDETIDIILFGQVSQFGRPVLRALREEVFNEAWAHLCVNRIEVALAE